EALPATVAIEGKMQDGSESAGSGFFVDSNGIIITNLHVVKGLIAARVRLTNGDSYDRISVRAYDETKDIAILHIPGFGLPTVKLGDSDRVETGAPVIVIGNALGILEGTASTGIVSAIRPLDGYRVFQTDAA